MFQKHASNKPKCLPFYHSVRCTVCIGTYPTGFVGDTLESAQKRGAKIYAEIVGYGSTSDAFHMTAPDNAADGLTKAIELTLEDAKVSPTDVGYINAHGTSTLLNDKIETLGY